MDVLPIPHDDPEATEPEKMIQTEEGWIEEELVVTEDELSLVLEEEVEIEDVEDVVVVGEEDEEEGLSTSSSAADAAILRQQCQILQQMQIDKREWNEEFDELLEEMRDLRSQMTKKPEKQPTPPDNSEKIEALVSSIADIQEASRAFKDSTKEEMDSLRKELASNDRGAKGDVSPKSNDNELEMLRREIKDIKHSSKEQLRELRNELERARSESNSVKDNMKSMRSELAEVEKFRVEISAIKAFSIKQVKELTKELDKTRAELTSTKESMETLRRDLAEKEANSAKEEVKKFAETKASIKAVLKKTKSPKPLAALENDATRDIQPKAPKTPKTPKKPKTTPKTPKKPTIHKSPATVLSSLPFDVTSSPIKKQSSPSKLSKTPKSPRKTLPSIEPHSIDDLAKAQRKDKALKEYLKSQTGLPYTYGSMSIRDCVGESGKDRHLVLFQHRVYVPEKLRQLTLEHIVENQPRESLAVLKERFVWPNCEKDLTSFKIKPLPTLFQSSMSSLTGFHD